MRPRALDLFCCGGGASMGLHCAGFDVTGVDINPQPHYPFRFVHADATAPPFALDSFDFVWASPPCQAFSVLRHLTASQAASANRPAREYPNLIPQVRAMLAASGVPYAIENVERAPLDGPNVILLCGTMFGLQTRDGSALLRRHRKFETSFQIPLRPQCNHRRKSLTVISICGYGSPRVWDSCRDLRQRDKFITVTGNTPQRQVKYNSVRETYSIHDARAAMGIDWLPMRWLSQAVPPAYSEFIGREALRSMAR